MRYYKKKNKEKTWVLKSGAFGTQTHDNHKKIYVCVHVRYIYIYTYICKKNKYILV